MTLWQPNTPFRPARSPLQYGWIIAVVGTLGMVASVPGQTVGVNVFSEKLMAALELSRTNVSAAYFVGTALSGLALPFAGTLYDRFGARRLVVAACVGLASSLVYLSLVNSATGSYALAHWMAEGRRSRWWPARFGRTIRSEGWRSRARRAQRRGR